MAERGGFEPPVRFNPYNGLANRRIRPLCHLSNQLITSHLSVNQGLPVTRGLDKLQQMYNTDIHEI
jgi:hypothetical protein